MEREGESHLDPTAAPERSRPAGEPAGRDLGRPDISLFFPVYKDDQTIRELAQRALRMLAEVAADYEVVIVDDGSPDRSGEIADELASVNPRIRVAHHPRNLGYGAAMKRGISLCKHDWICMVDGDNEYDVYDLKRMLALRAYYPLVIGFRYKKLYSALRIFISYVYNATLRYLFRTRFRDISTGIRLIHRSVLHEVTLSSDSPFIGAELAIKAMLRGFPVGEVGIQTFPRTFGQGSATSLPNILRTIRDIYRMHREVYSDTYSLPEGRRR
ncbi:MAG: glycosyltransferase family 2 protein [Thermoanaerobaculia bacterium]|nr:glycosyltransferase family 2 protein [Thermoanaerobaculia bacterium]